MQIQKNTFIMYNNKPYYVVDASHHAMGRGRGVINARLKDVVTGAVIPVTFKANADVEPADVAQDNAQYLYADDDNLYFMNPETYEQFSLPKKVAGDLINYLKEGETYVLYFYNGKAVAINTPKIVILEVIEAPPGVKGDSAQGATKRVTLETGIKVDVPLFINKGDKIKVSPETGKYVERA